MSRALRGVLFDLGGTLFHHQDPASARNNLLAATAMAGIRAPEAAVAEAFATARQATEQAWTAKPCFLHRDLVADSLRNACLALGAEAPEAAVDAYCDRQRDSVLGGLRLRRDTIDTLAALRREGCWVAIVSNIDEDYLQPLVQRHGLAGHLDHWLSSEAAGSCKPHRGIFEQAIRRAREPAANLLYVGDHPVNDVAGAQRVGLATALLDVDLDDRVSLPVTPDHRVQSLAALLPIVRGHH